MDLVCSVVGLGKLGACMAACLASRGLEVIGVDVRADVADALSAGRAPVFEPGLADLVWENRRRLHATTDVGAAVLASDVTFVVVPTPSDGEGIFSIEHVTDAARSIGRAIGRKAGYHLVVLTSTVAPGSTDGEVRATLERTSGSRCGTRFGLCYSPEFVALGTVLRDFLHPDFVLIGESDPDAGARLADLYANVYGGVPPIVRTSFVNAELAKLAVNTFVTTKISYANMLAELCEALPGADVDEVTGAVGLDPRIGASYLRGGLGYGGPCFPRDNLALGAIARGLGVPSNVPEATDRYNRALPDRLARIVLEHARPDDTIGILGLAYKPGSVVVEESQGLALARRLNASGVRVLTFDPVVDRGLPADIVGSRVEDLDRLLHEASVVVVANPDPAFDGLTPARFRRRPLVVIDGWRSMRTAFERVAGVRYIGIGLGPTPGRPEPVEVRLGSPVMAR
jgi:UDPglucose 6-dehydrogenase